MSLYQGLVAHLRPALYRLKQNMGISNPLLSRIQDDYHEMFLILEKAVKEIFPELQVPKEEIGYLVMHFSSALLNRDGLKEHKTLVICSCGIGTSKMLSTKLEQEIPGLKTVSASLFDLAAMDVDEFDVIVSTIPLKNFKEERVARGPIRKLGPNDRLISPALQYYEYLEGKPVNLAKVIAAVLKYDFPKDEEAVALQVKVKEQGYEKTMYEVCGVKEGHPLVELVLHELTK